VRLRPLPERTVAEVAEGVRVLIGVGVVCCTTFGVVEHPAMLTSKATTSIDNNAFFVTEPPFILKYLSG
jgi:hypothetical protein